MIYKSLLKPLLFRLEAERAHKMTINLAKRSGRSSVLSSFINELYDFQSSLLTQNFWGLTFRNPVGAAAGFDKNGHLLPALQTLGMGFHEVGSVTTRPSPGNPKPRAFRLPADRAIINRMGLNNDGAARIMQRLKKVKRAIPLGINIAKTHDASITGPAAIRDYAQSYAQAAGVADYIAVNISCPNTSSGKTFEEPKTLDHLLAELLTSTAENRPPTLVKFSADLEESKLKELIDICENHAVNGYIACNTSTKRSHLNTERSKLEQIGKGGLSGAPLTFKSLQVVRWIREVIGDQKPVIGVGGIDSFEKALAMLRAGANLLQVYTGLIYEGPGLVKKINRGLVQHMQQHDIESIADIT